MFHFRAVVPVSARQTITGIRGTKSTGLCVKAQAKGGAIRIDLYYNERLDRDEYTIRHCTNLGRGISEVIERGVIGQRIVTD